MNVAILGTNEISQTVAKTIEEGYNPWLKTKLAEPLNVVAYVSRVGIKFPVIGNTAVLDLILFAALYRKKVIDKIIFPREVYRGIENHIIFLKTLGVKLEDICLTQRLHDEISLTNFIEPYSSAKYLPYLEFRIADHCNMNCKACAEFSSLVRKPHFPNLEKFTQDFEQLHKFIDDIGTIFILGGEPLLNSQINEYIKLSRRLYPQSTIKVLTNGILLTKMPDEFFDTIRECNVEIFISLYFPLEDKIESIKKFLDDKKVLHNANEKPKGYFFVNTCLKPNAEVQLFKCGFSGCRNLWEGNLANCYKSSAIKIFNEYFNQNLPENSGLINLYDPTLTTEKLQARLVEPFELCKYCSTKTGWREWGRVKHPASMSDWLVD